MNFIAKTILLLLILISYSVQGQKKKGYEDPNAALKVELEGYKKDCRIALKPYRYDGQKTTFFSYKSYTYMKEVEIATIQQTDYRFSINAQGIHGEKIEIKIYDKPKEQKGRILLYEKSGVGGNAFTFESGEMVEKLREYKLKKGVDKDIVDMMYLKKVYIDYVIPAVERITEEDEYTGRETVKEERAAIVVCLGYLNL